MLLALANGLEVRGVNPSVLRLEIAELEQVADRPPT
jgi:hypothetical protein